jgi:geranylgeranyl diphosphate synthase, type I
MVQDRYDFLLEQLGRRKQLVQQYLMQEEYQQRFRPAHIRDAALSYLRMGGKSLRAAVLLLSCGAVGGDEEIALPAAAAVEMYHTWTLVHDDVIDRDERRRGTPTVHVEFTDRAQTDLGLQGEEARHYGMSVAMLTGDLQQGWSWSLMFELYLKNRVDPGLVLTLTQEMATYVHPTLIEGEILDVQFSHHAERPTEAMVTDMLWRKTGVLYEFCGRAGAAIGLNDPNPEHPQTKAIRRFCSLSGTAFQIQDDILGVIGDAQKLGKPVGSDVREGKNTLLTLRTLERADERQRAFLDRTLGDPAASADEVAQVVDLMRDLGVIDDVQRLAHSYIDEAREQLLALPPSPQRELLDLWARYVVERAM